MARISRPSVRYLHDEAVISATLAGEVPGVANHSPVRYEARRANVAHMVPLTWLIAPDVVDGLRAWAKTLPRLAIRDAA